MIAGKLGSVLLFAVVLGVFVMVLCDVLSD